MFKSVSGPTRENASLDDSFTNLDSWAYIAIISDDQIADYKHVLLTLLEVGTVPEFDDQPETGPLSFRMFNI